MISRAASEGVIATRSYLRKAMATMTTKPSSADVAERIDGDAELRQVVDAAEVGDGERDEQKADALLLDAARFRIGADEFDERNDQIAEEEQQERRRDQQAVARVVAPPELLHAHDEDSGDAEDGEDRGHAPTRPRSRRGALSRCAASPR